MSDSPDPAASSVLFLTCVRDEGGNIVEYIYSAEVARFKWSDLSADPVNNDVLAELDRQFSVPQPMQTRMLQSGPPGPGMEDAFRFLATRFLATGNEE